MHFDIDKYLSLDLNYLRKLLLPILLTEYGVVFYRKIFWGYQTVS